MTQIGKDLKALMEKQGGNICLLSQEIEALRGTIRELVEEIGNVRTEVQELQQRWTEFIEEEEVARTEILEFRDRAYTDAMMEESEAQEMMEENENEYYTQSFNYISGLGGPSPG